MATLAMLHHVERLQPPTHRRCMSDPLKRGRAAQVQLLAAADGRLDINASESPKRIRPTAPPPPPAVVEAPPLDIECAICSGPMENPAVGGGW